MAVAQGERVAGFILITGLTASDMRCDRSRWASSTMLMSAMTRRWCSYPVDT
jgi:hypothetical protein